MNGLVLLMPWFSVGKYDLMFVCLYTSLRSDQDFEGTHVLQIPSIVQIWHAGLSLRENSSKTEEAKCLNACLSLRNRKFPLLETEAFSFFNRKNMLQ